MEQEGWKSKLILPLTLKEQLESIQESKEFLAVLKLLLGGLVKNE